MHNALFFYFCCVLYIVCVLLVMKINFLFINAWWPMNLCKRKLPLQPLPRRLDVSSSPWWPVFTEHLLCAGPHAENLGKLDQRKTQEQNYWFLQKLSFFPDFVSEEEQAHLWVVICIPKKTASTTVGLGLWVVSLSSEKQNIKLEVYAREPPKLLLP